ncbi:helicase SKI2W [Diachasma alloeum]|uniref:helicase SKI2W n=1 Tax=Diachasma alloeum TaxID=454923 RepID=UPI0007381CB7|nr:helicase SKI2W [Diachasma alloeum]XP_015116158.1 helicase SKI2W [Diachasma alloeum]XP_015116159.1 helicase SKI2W [Diachasma alloeum]
MSSTASEAPLELPFGPPPILSDIRDELKEYIECPERLPIHQVENVQLYWPREPQILALLEFDLSPVGTTLKFDRDPITGRISQMREDVLQGAGENAKNSMSMTRAPGPPMEGVQGNSSNFPFWPGGFEEPEAPRSAPTAKDLDFENNLRTLARGFRSSVEFAPDNFTVKTASKEDDPSGQKKKKKGKDNSNNSKPLEKVNLMAMVHDEENHLGLWSEPSPEDLNSTKDVIEDSAIESLDVLNFDESIPVLKLTEKPKSMARQAEWAEQLDVSVPVVDFEKKVPKPAITFDYELDTFQKQAIIKLEEGCNVFVAAHTSAGKTTVAEYAIALSQRHMTRVIYTSPIKALSNQKYRDFKRNRHFESVGLVTGDMQINQTANCLIMTTEILQTMLYNASEVLRDLEYVIFDEVHYINDEHRGHVWEEIVILLPPNVNIVMLSATVPNPLIFANWVGNIKKRRMYVISTLKRPVPLKHYLYAGTDGKTRNDRFLVLDGDGQFNLDNWYKIKTLKDGKSKNKNAPVRNNNRRQQLNPKQEKTMWEAFIAHLREHDKLPVVIFTLSRNRCDANANALVSVNLTTETEKGHVRAFFKKCIKRLNESDQQLPQVRRMAGLLERGIGVHHSGILPILKEIIELLFQNGVVKLLFATETFAMGINMPARTVVFDSIRKFDGKQFRGLLPTEYIQMAGRAGRRGHDKVGTVILMCKTEVPAVVDLKAMMCGEPQHLQSQFKITYSMVLNLRRVSESVSIEEMMRRSFKELSFTADKNKRLTELNEIDEALAKLPQENDVQKQLSKFYRLGMEYVEEWKYLCAHLFSTKKVSKALIPGRVLIISHRHHYRKLAVLLKISQKREITEYAVLVLSDSSESRLKDKPENWYKIIALTKRNIFVPEGVPSHEFLCIQAESILEITNCCIKADPARVYDDCVKRQISRFQNDPPGQTCQLAIQQLNTLSLMALTRPVVLQPYLEASVSHPELIKRTQYLTKLQHQIQDVKVTEMPNLGEHFEEVFAKNELERRRRDLQFQLSDESMALYPEYVNRVDVLKKLGYIDTDDRVTLKGRVALDMGTHELLITELIYRNILTNLQPAEIAALISALVFQGKSDSRDKQIPDLKLPILKDNCRIIEEVRSDIERTEMAYGVDPVEPLSFGLVEVVYEWARAESFAKIMELTDVQEGIIVRCIQQLNDTLQDIKTAAHRIGETVLKEKMEEASTAIKRDIVFTASLYTQD